MPASASPVRRHRRPVPPYALAVLAACLLALYGHSHLWEVVQDDAFTSFAYAQNLVAGHGLTFSPSERSAGSSNFLWTLLLALPHALGIGVVPFAQWTGLLAAAGSFAGAFSISLLLGGRRMALFALPAPVVLAANGAFAYWAFSGMETALFTLTLTWGAYAYLRASLADGPQSSTDWKIGLLFGLAALTRPEGMLFFGLANLHRLWLRRRFDAGDFIRFNLPFLCLVGPYLAFRLFYYGALFTPPSAPWPTALVHGLAYALKFQGEYGLWGLSLLAPLVLARGSRTAGWGVYLALTLWGGTVYTVLAGGDALGANRLYAPLLPLFYVALQEAFYRLLHLLPAAADGLRKSLSPGIVGALVLGTALTAVAAYALARPALDGQYAYVQAQNSARHNLAAYINGRPDAQDLTLAASGSGILRYRTPARVLAFPEAGPGQRPQDLWSPPQRAAMLALLDRTPDLIPFIGGVPPQTPAEKALLLSQRFRRGYYLVYFSGGQAAFARVPGYAATSDTLFPDPAFVEHYIAGLDAGRDGRVEVALREYTECLRVGPEDFSYPLLWMGELHFKEGRYDEALPHFRLAVERDPFNVWAHSYLALITLGETGQLARALGLAARAARLAPDSQFTRYIYGLALLMDEDLAPAAEHLQAAADMPGTNRGKARLYLGMAHYLQGDAAKARRLWEDLLAAEPDNAQARTYLEQLQEGE